MTQTEMARLLGIAQPTLSAYAGRGCPTDTVEAARAWMDANLKWRRRKGVRVMAATASGGMGAAEGTYTASISSRLVSERLRREAAEAAMAELKLGELRGDLVRLAEVRAAHSRRLVMLRESLMQVPSRLAAVLAAASDLGACHGLIEDEIISVLTQVAAVAGQPLAADDGAGGSGRDCDPAAAA